MSAATLTIPEAAELLGISRNSAYQAVQSGELVGVPVLKVGRRLLLPRAPLFAVLGLQDEEPTEAGPSTIRTADEDGATSRPRPVHRTTT